jgi:hypothetical protein
MSSEYDETPGFTPGVFVWCYTPARFLLGDRHAKKIGDGVSGVFGPAGLRTIRAGNVIDPATGAVAKNQIIVVQNGKIAAIGAGISIPKDAQVIDLSNEWVMPGLIDAHTHMTLNELPGKAPFEAVYLKESTAFRGFRGLHNSQG